MPTYCYRESSGKLHDFSFPMSDVPEEVEHGGKKLKRCREAEWASQGGQRPDSWPIKSNALAVHKSQRQEYQDFASKHGVPTEFDEKGKPKFTSQKHQDRYCSLIGAVNYDR